MERFPDPQGGGYAACYCVADGEPQRPILAPRVQPSHYTALVRDEYYQTALRHGGLQCLGLAGGLNETTEGHLQACCWTRSRPRSKGLLLLDPAT
ncbi:hypothetical protein NDU88_001401 [Pleurodeles waltl]|uniref:Uncharacterized protein n=1 Tax=Pleurodeles waltl TaxID=8319 RepID=A0AAV7VWC7_PLEWA|nr:hypothetical protein NDU88_001401 [Pleurodeles waltl]